MKTICFALLGLILVAGFERSLQARDQSKSAQEASVGQVRQSLIASTEWLAQHLNDDSLVLLQVGERDEYLAAHIPRAQFITLADISTPRGKGLTLELPPITQLKMTFEKLGVSDKSRIVVYFSKDWVTPTARVMTLDYLGLGDRTSILDGGLPAWRAEGSVTSPISLPQRQAYGSNSLTANSWFQFPFANIEAGRLS